MTRENFQQLKNKELRMRSLKEQKHLIENGVMLSIAYTLADDSGAITYNEIKGSDLPKGAIKEALLANITKRIAHAEAEWDKCFDGVDIFEEQ